MNNFYKVTNNEQDSTSRKLKKLSFLLILLVLVFYSCLDSFIQLQQDNVAEEKGQFSLVLDGSNGAERTILPKTIKNDFAAYTLEFFIAGTNTHVGTPIERNNGNLSSTVLLDAGTYDLNVKAYIDVGKTKLAASGELKNIVISSGATVNKSVTLTPIFDGVGKGIYNWNVNYPSNVIEASMTITRLPINPGNDIQTISIIDVASKTGSLELLTGFYRVVFKLKNDKDLIAERWETLHIYQNMQSDFAFTFTENQFNGALTGIVSINGNPQVGETLTADTSLLGGSGIITYQWMRSGVIINGANSSTYKVQDADAGLTIAVTVTRSGNSGSVTSDPTATIIILPLTGTVGINGTLQTGQTLTVDVSNLNGNGTLSYQWKRGSQIVGSDSNSYIVVSDDVGNNNFTLTVSRVNYSGSVTSKPMLTGTVGIAGTLKTGQTLTGSFTHSCTGAVSYQWRRESTVVGSNSNTYTVVADDVGVFNFNLRVKCSNHSGWVENIRHRVLSITENSGYNYNNGILTITNNGTYNIKMNESVNMITSDRIVVNSGVSANITLSNVYIDLSGTNSSLESGGYSAFDMTGATVNLTLVGENILASGGRRAGLQAPSGTTLSINGVGSLTATGGYYGAGIGGGSSSASGVINILGGTITAKGGLSGSSAGIGGGNSGGSGEIKISGGTVTAEGSTNGPGIGTSSSTLRGNIIISDGVITANSGSQGNLAINGDSINITNSIVIATSRGYIHDYLQSSNIAISCKTINIQNSTITTNAINCEVINTIGDNAVIFASYIQPSLSNIENLGSAIIFIGSEGEMYNNVVLSRNVTFRADRILNINSGQTLTIQSGYTLTNNGTIFKDNGSNIIGEERIVGNKPISPSLTISGGSSYTYTGGILSINGNGTYTIGMRGGVTSTTGDRIIVSSGVTANITLSNVNIDMSDISNACAFDMTGATVNLTLAGANVFKSGKYRAGLEVPEGSSLVITNSSSGSITVLGGYNGAGIGGSDIDMPLNNGGHITVNGGTVTATGGDYGAGIGGGTFVLSITASPYYFGGSGGTFIINDGVVTARGGISSAGIGGATQRSGFSNIFGGSNGIITRNGGTLNIIDGK